MSDLTLYEGLLYHILITPLNVAPSHLTISTDLLLEWLQLPLDDRKRLLNIMHVHHFGSRRLLNNCIREMDILKWLIPLACPISSTVLKSGKVICRYFRIVWLKAQ